jgi:hypothetical protein
MEAAAEGLPSTEQIAIGYAIIRKLGTQPVKH